MRSGLWHFDPQTGARERVAEPPYDPAEQRFNDGKADPQGRFWVATLDDRRRPQAALYRWADGELMRMAEGATVGNGLAWSADGRTQYWADTTAHVVRAYDVDEGGALSRARVFARFEPRGPGSLARWLHTAVLNKIRNKADWYGTQKRAADVPLTDTLGGRLAARSDAAPAYIEAERWQPLENALAELPPDMREAVVLRTVEGLSNADAASAMGKSSEATSKLYNRAIARLGTRLAGGTGP